MTAGPLDQVLIDRLLVQAGRGDVEALASLYDRTAPTIYGLITSALVEETVDARGVESAAGQVAERVYLHAWRIAPRYDPARGRALSVLVGSAHRTLVALGHRPPRLADPRPVPPRGWATRMPLR